MKNGNLVKLVGVILLLVGFTDNIYSWLTPLTPVAAAFDGLLILAGAYLVFKRGNMK